MRRAARLVVVGMVLLLTGTSVVRGQVTGPSTGGAATLAQAARMLGHTKRVLMVGAHPDDEDTDLLTYLVRREGAVTGYLALTRGEGGQNLIGPELGEALGLIRTEELLAARRLDGARQFFTRAFDFGYSKTQDEALAFWPRDSLLKDAVRIVRRFRPQIIVARFSGTPADGHGQHQAAGWVAREAFRVAADPAAFPELRSEEGLEPWAPRKLYQSVRGEGPGDDLRLDAGILDVEAGQSLHQIAMRGRSLHRSQDMGALQTLGPSPIQLTLIEDRTGGGVALFAGVDTAPPRTGSAEAEDLARYAAVLALGRAGIVLDATANAGHLAPGSVFEVELVAWNSGAEAGEITMSLTAPRDWRVTGGTCLGRAAVLPPRTLARCEARVAVPEAEEPASPYFLRAARQGAWYRWSGPASSFGEPFDPPLLTARFAVTGAGLPGGAQVAEREVVERVLDQALGERRSPLLVVPRVGVSVDEPTRIWAVGASKTLAVTVTIQHGAADTTRGLVGLELPRGWTPVKALPFTFGRPGERRSFRFEVSGPPRREPGDAVIVAVARDQSGRRYLSANTIVSYPHIRERGIVVASATTVRSIDIGLPGGRRIGYVRGAADRVPEALAGVGLTVELLDPSALERGDLGRFDVIVIGSRAFEVDAALRENNGRLLEFVRRGGHLLVQYQQQTFFGGGYAPYSLTLSPRHDRVADETAPVTLPIPGHPVFKVPNTITPRDWDGWVQERGLYFASGWAPEFRSLLATADPGEAPLGGGLLIAPFGRGTYTYTGLAFFRQLTAGVPGAFRLFANLLSVTSGAAVP